MKRLATILKSTVRKYWERLDRPIPALPLDLFRIGVGALSAAYFWRIRRDVPTYSAPDGVIDHRLVRQMFPYTRISFYQLGMGESVFRRVNSAAIGASLGVAAGWGVRPNATFLYLTVVSTYRWNLPAMYVDDVVMHLVLFWLQLLPTGKTLILGKPTDWRNTTVPGFTTRLFLGNLALLYLVAGLWKWNSPLWRQGNALYATLKMPISRAPRFWPTWIRPISRPVSYAALILEPAFAALPFLPTHSRSKYALATSLVGFHVGIIATLNIPYANIACIGALPLYFHKEIMQSLAPTNPPDATTSLPQKLFAATTLTLLTLQNVWRIRERKPMEIQRSTRWRERWRLRSKLSHHHNPWTAPLYAIGLVQSYRLLDWVDDRNWYEFYEGEEEIDGEVRPFETNRLFPHTLRNVLLHSYIRNRCWIVPPSADLPTFQRSLLTRYVANFARQVPNCGVVTIYLHSSRIAPGNFDFQHVERFKLLQFEVCDGKPTIHFLRLMEA